jgi:hypothetical protein
MQGPVTLVDALAARQAAGLLKGFLELMQHPPLADSSDKEGCDGGAVVVGKRRRLNCGRPLRVHVVMCHKSEHGQRGNDEGKAAARHPTRRADMSRLLFGDLNMGAQREAGHAPCHGLR